MDPPENLRKQSLKNSVTLRTYSILTGCIVWTSETPALKAVGLPGATILCCGASPIICLILTPLCGFFGSHNRSKCLLITYLTCNICGIITNFTIVGLFSALLSGYGFVSADCEGVKSVDCIILASPVTKIFVRGTICFGLISILFEAYACYLSCKTFNNPYFGHEIIYNGGLPISVSSGGAIPVAYYGNPTYVQGLPTPVTEPAYMPKTTLNGYAPVAVYSQPSPQTSS